MKPSVSVGIFIFCLVNTALAQEVPPTGMPQMQGQVPSQAPSAYGGSVGVDGNWPPSSNSIPPELIESMKSQLPPGFPNAPGGHPLAMPPPTGYKPQPPPPSGRVNPNAQAVPNMNPSHEQIKSDKAAEKAREQMRKALRESAMERQRESESAKGRKPPKAQLEN